MLKWWKDAATKAKVTRRVWLHQLSSTRVDCSVAKFGDDGQMIAQPAVEDALR